jgi:hypothetical protein
MTRQLCMFCGGDASEAHHRRRCDGRQGAIEGGLPSPAVARAARDQAMTAVAARAEAQQPRFVEQAAVFVLAFLRQNGPTPGEMVSVACKAAGIVPHDDRAFGPVYFTLARRGLIQRVGQVRRQRGHGTTGGNVWAVV